MLGSAQQLWPSCTLLCGAPTRNQTAGLVWGSGVYRIFPEWGPGRESEGEALMDLLGTAALEHLQGP